MSRVNKIGLGLVLIGMNSIPAQGSWIEIVAWFILAVGLFLFLYEKGD